MGSMLRISSLPSLSRGIESLRFLCLCGEKGQGKKTAETQRAQRKMGDSAYSRTAKWEGSLLAGPFFRASQRLPLPEFSGPAGGRPS